MDIIENIKQKYGEGCSLCPPLDKASYIEAASMLPAELYDTLKTANGVKELMTLENANDGKPFVIGYVLYPFEDIKSETEAFKELYGEEGIVFAGDGAGGYYVIAEDGGIYHYEYVGEDGDLCADDLSGFFAK